MKSIATFSLTCLISLAAVVSPASAAHHEEGEHHSPLHESMEKMGDIFKPLGRALKDPQAEDKDQYLEWLQELQLLAVESKAYVPDHIASLPESEQAGELAAYRVDLTHAVGSLLELERLVIAEDWPAVQEEWTSLRRIRGESHKRYDPDE